MNLQQEMIEIFDREDLIYVVPERLSNIKLPQLTREFILETGFPYVVDYFRFSMDFEAISDDIEIGNFTKHLGKLYTIGCKPPTPLVGRTIHLSEINLDKNASLSDIGRRVRLLGVDELFLFNLEVTDSCRICIDANHSYKIISISPKDLSISFLNSSIQQLAASLVAYGRYCLLEEVFEKRIVFLQEELKKIDPKSLDCEKNVWTSIIERLIINSEELY